MTNIYYKIACECERRLIILQAMKEKSPHNAKWIAHYIRLYTEQRNQMLWLQRNNGYYQVAMDYLRERVQPRV